MDTSTLSMPGEYQKALRYFNEKYPEQHPRPVGWYRFFASDGKQHGHGFYCPKCHLVMEPNVQEVRHCGRLERIPSLFRRIMHLQSYRVPKKLLVI